MSNFDFNLNIPFQPEPEIRPGEFPESVPPDDIPESVPDVEPPEAVPPVEEPDAIPVIPPEIEPTEPRTPEE